MYQNISEILDNGFIDLSGRFMIPIFLSPVYGLYKKEFPELIVTGSTNDCIMRNWSMVRDRSLVPDVVIQGRGECLNFKMDDKDQILTMFKGFVCTYLSLADLKQLYKAGYVKEFRMAIEDWFGCMSPVRRLKQYGGRISDSTIEQMANVLFPPVITKPRADSFDI